jgi:hypothetical protein
MPKERMWKFIANLLPDLTDLLVFGGLGCAAYGAWLVYQPAGFIAAGVALFWLGIRRP